MKKIALLIMSVLMAMGLSSCGALLYTVDVMGTGLIAPWTSAENTDSSLEEEEEKTYTITFQQIGFEDVVKEVKEGETLTDIPEPQPQTGYTVVWEEVNLANVQENLIVNAVETPNTYTVTYNTNGGTLSSLTQEVTFDSEVILATPTREGYDFTGWTCEGKSVTDGKWKIAQDVTLDAQYVEIVPEYVTVTFNKAGEDPVSVELLKGQSLDASDYPVLEQKTGYIIAWDKTLEELTNLTENVTVTAVERAKTYTIILNTNGGTLESTTYTVTYGEKYSLPVPTRLPEGATNYSFTGWTYNGEKVSRTGVWTLDEDGREYVATWTTDEWSGWY